MKFTLSFVWLLQFWQLIAGSTYESAEYKIHEYKFVNLNQTTKLDTSLQFEIHRLSERHEEDACIATCTSNLNCRAVSYSRYSSYSCSMQRLLGKPHHFEYYS